MGLVVEVVMTDRQRTWVKKLAGALGSCSVAYYMELCKIDERQSVC